MKVVLVTREWSSWPQYAGSTWVPMQYVLGFQRLGVEALWLDHLSPPDPATAVHGVEYLIQRFEATAREFGYADRWCVLYDRGARAFGRTQAQARDFVEAAELLLSLSGKGLPPPLPLAHVPRRAYVDVDPAFTQVWALEVDMGLADYNLHFTVGQNVGRPDFRAPTLGFEWVPMLPPVVLDLWPACNGAESAVTRFSTIGDWWGGQQAKYEGQYYGGKRGEFLRFLRVPLETRCRIEAALTLYPSDSEDLELLTQHRWRLLEPARVAGDPHAYREFIRHSRAEFSVAKSGYVRSRSGWISDRTAVDRLRGAPPDRSGAADLPHRPGGPGRSARDRRGLRRALTRRTRAGRGAFRRATRAGQAARAGQRVGSCPPPPCTPAPRLRSHAPC
jgi:hypothetical protein